MEFKKLKKRTLKLFCFKDFYNLTEERTALKDDVEYLFKSIESFPIYTDFSDSNLGITTLNSILKELKSVCIKKDPISVLKSDKLTYTDVLIVLSVFIEEISHKKVNMSRNIVWLY